MHLINLILNFCIFWSSKSSIFVNFSSTKFQNERYSIISILFCVDLDFWRVYVPAGMRSEPYLCQQSSVNALVGSFCQSRQQQKLSQRRKIHSSLALFAYLPPRCEQPLIPRESPIFHNRKQTSTTHTNGTSRTAAICLGNCMCVCRRHRRSDLYTPAPPFSLARSLRYVLWKPVRRRRQRPLSRTPPPFDFIWWPHLICICSGGS